MNPNGRPNKHLSEKKFLFSGPATMLRDIRAAAAAEEITVSEWLRRAASARLVAILDTVREKNE